MALTATVHLKLGATFASKEGCTCASGLVHRTVTGDIIGTGFVVSHLFAIIGTDFVLRPICLVYDRGWCRGRWLAGYDRKDIPGESERKVLWGDQF